MIPPRPHTTHPSEGLAAALQEMAEAGASQLVVLEDGLPVGLLTREGIVSFLQSSPGFHP